MSATFVDGNGLSKIDTNFVNVTLLGKQDLSDDSDTKSFTRAVMCLSVVSFTE